MRKWARNKAIGNAFEGTEKLKERRTPKQKEPSHFVFIIKIRPIFVEYWSMKTYCFTWKPYLSMQLHVQNCVEKMDDETRRPSSSTEKGCGAVIVEPKKKSLEWGIMPQICNSRLPTQWRSPEGMQEAADQQGIIERAFMVMVMRWWWWTMMIHFPETIQ